MSHTQQPIQPTSTAASRNLPHGVFPVMLTPFTPSGAIDEAGLDALIEWYLGNGATGLFACCQSSEIEQLGWEERCWLARRVVERARGRVPVIAVGSIGVGDLAAEAAMLRAIAATGVDVAVAITGHIIPREADDEQATRLLERLADATPGVPLGLYECPRPYKRLISVDGVARLAASGRWRYLKDTACVPEVTAAKIRAAAGSPLAIYEACAANFSTSLEAGAAGVSPIIANLVPDLVAQLCATRDPELQRGIAELAVLAEVGYPIAVKQALAIAGLPIHPLCRRRCDGVPAGHGAELARRAAALRERFAAVHA
jgi:4-hydroxy-tetrahydrodipicolinate synthase